MDQNLCMNMAGFAYSQSGKVHDVTTESLASHQQFDKKHTTHTLCGKSNTEAHFCALKLTCTHTALLH